MTSTISKRLMSEGGMYKSRNSTPELGPNLAMKSAH